MGTFADGIVSGLRQVYCSLVSVDPQWLANLRRVVTPQPIQDIGNAINSFVCDRDPDLPVPLPPPPFTGGQCDCAIYEVTYAGNGTSDQLGNPFTRQGVIRLRGPLGFVGLFNNNSQFGLTARSGPWIPTATPQSCGGVRVVPVAGWGFPSSDFVMTTLNVARIDNNGVDDCGNPEPDLPGPGGDVVTNINIRYGPNNEFDITVPVIFAPVFASIDGRLNVPVTINLPDFVLNGNLEIFPDFNFSPSLNVGRPRLDDGPGSEPSPVEPDKRPEDTGDDSPPEDDATDNVFFAVLVRSVISQGAVPTEIFQPDGPNTYAPRIGSVRFGSTIGGVTFWSNDIDVKQLNAVITVPFAWGASRVVVNPQVGVAMNWAPVSTTPPAYPPFLEIGQTREIDRR